MEFKKVFTNEKLEEKAKLLFAEERALKRLDGWFLIREISQDFENANMGIHNELRKAGALKAVCQKLPISISDNNIFAGTQRDAFARSYALINPNFKVSTFNGYCDPTAVFDDIEPDGEFTEKRISDLRQRYSRTDYVRELKKVYAGCETDTSEVAYFVEQVTGHLIPDMRPVLKHGVKKLIADIDRLNSSEKDEAKKISRRAMKDALEALIILAGRYADLAAAQKKNAGPKRKAELELMEKTLRKVPYNGAENLFEAVQSFILLWQLMCMEQAPNPFAFSVGNADRIFEPYRSMDGASREQAAGLFKHLLVFFNVGDRSWAISQNLIVGGKSNKGEDLTSETTYALLDAYFAMNLPQPILSVKLHKDTPDELYKDLGRFFFTPGCLTPSLFSDDSMFEVLKKSGVSETDLEDYSIAGCQEPLIMGKDNANTTNSWLNLPKILELTITGGKSLITGKQIGPTYKEMGAENAKDILSDMRGYFYRNVDAYTKRMADAANGASRALSNLPVPFLSCLMGGVISGIDTRDVKRQGTKYNGSGCLIHGMAIVADSFVAVDRYLKDKKDCAELIEALESDYAKNPEIRDYLLSCPKYGQNIKEVDDEAALIAEKVCETVRGLKNYLGNGFRADWSSPTTHLLYGYWVGATPDGRRSREMLGYGIDPLYGEATGGLGLRMLSAYKLPFLEFNGGYASHLGLDPKYFRGATLDEKGLEFKHKIFNPLFFPDLKTVAPYYVYVNVTTPETLRKVLANPKKYAPSGVYIMRIHGTFVNFLDLSPEIQEDIIKRLDLNSTAVC